MESGVEQDGIGITWAQPHQLFVIYLLSGSIHFRKSEDDAATWEEAVEIFASGDYPNIAADPANGLLYAFRHDGSDLVSKRSVDGGATWQSEIVVVSSCPAQQCGVTVRPDESYSIYVSYKDAGGAIQTAISKDNGLTWG